MANLPFQSYYTMEIKILKSWVKCSSFYMKSEISFQISIKVSSSGLSRVYCIFFLSKQTDAGNLCLKV